jgi:hypothetical protein
MISLVITPLRNHTYSFPTQNCNYLICFDCFNKITGGNNNDYLPKVGDFLYVFFVDKLIIKVFLRIMFLTNYRKKF